MNKNLFLSAALFFSAAACVFSQSESDLAESLADVSKESGVDLSQISYRFEYYNPDASTPSYTYTYPKK